MAGAPGGGGGAPLVSVLLPYRDVAPLLGEALAGLLAERVPLEILAVDDGSRDEGPALVRALAARDRRVVPLAAGGVGIARALDLAARAARAPYLARMDGDDVSLPGRLEAELALLERDERLGVVGTLVEAFPEDVVGEGMKRYVAWMNSLVTPEEHERDLWVEQPLCHPSVLMRRSALLAAGGYREVPWAEDYDLWLRMHAAGWRMAKVPRVYLRWRHRAGRATFADPRYALERFFDLKAHYLGPKLAAMGRPLAVWGAGKTGRRMARALGRTGAGVRAELFIDIDPRKIGRTAQGAPIRDPGALERGRHTVVVAVGAQGARALIRTHLGAAGFVEGVDYLCAS